MIDEATRPDEFADMAKPWLTERELDLLRAIHNGEVVSEHRRHRWGFYRRNIGVVTALVERLEAKDAITVSGPGKPQITIAAEALPLIGAGR
jgi:hypothetical protein